MTLGQRIKERRKEIRMTQEELSKASGVGRITINRLETEELVNPTISTLRKIAVGLDIPERELFK